MGVSLCFVRTGRKRPPLNRAGYFVNYCKSSKLDDKTQIQNINDIAEITITLDEITMIYKKITQFAGTSTTYKLDLENFGLINNLFSLEYNKVIAIIALLAYRTKQKNDGTFRLKIMPFFGSEVILSLN